MERDRGCVAPVLDPDIDACAGPLHRQHVLEMGGRRVTTMATVLILCAHHHLDGWATRKENKASQREYLRRVG